MSDADENEISWCKPIFVRILLSLLCICLRPTRKIWFGPPREPLTSGRGHRYNNNNSNNNNNKNNIILECVRRNYGHLLTVDKRGRGLNTLP